MNRDLLARQRLVYAQAYIDTYLKEIDELTKKKKG